MALVVQQRQWQCSYSLAAQQRLSGAATAMAVQQRLRWHSNGNGDGGAALGVAVVVAAQQWQRSNGGGGAAMVVDRSHRRVRKLISYVAFYVGPIQTGFLMMFQKSYGGTGIVIPVKKTPQEWKMQESRGFLEEYAT